MNFRYIFTYIFSIIVFYNTSVKAQINIIKADNKESEELILNDGNIINKLVLKNGLTVYLDHDESKSKVWGAVVVNGGVKSEDNDVSGLAHYFEHMMFKGTSIIGTYDYNSEKIYLDSIQQMFDLLQYSKDDEGFREGVIKKIDYYSQKAAKYVNPNEFSRLVTQLGGDDLNAYTTYENIVYYNSIPTSSLEQWLHLYSHRFKDPVFRLFPSELQLVYEEKNMSLDNLFVNIYEDVYSKFYPNSVYGQKTVLGTIEDLKNPSITKLKTYYKKNYIASNMALILSGNLDIPNLNEVLNETFGRLANEYKVDPPVSVEPNFNGREKHVSRLSPVPFGILGFRTVAESHEDMLVLDFIEKLMSNEQEIGMLDNLAKDNKLMMVRAYNDKHTDIGGSFFAYIPKPFIQSLRNGEKLVLNEIEKIKNGNIDKELVEAIKQMYSVEFYKKLENSEQRLNLIIEAYMNGVDFSQIYNRSERIQSVDIAEISRVANKYFNQDYFVYYSKTGFPKHKKIDYNKLSPLSFESYDGESEYSRYLNEIDNSGDDNQVFDISGFVKKIQLKTNYDLYHTNNPYNNVFSMTIKIGVGTYEKPVLEQLASYLNIAGTSTKAGKEFIRNLQALGSSINFYTSQSYFYIEIQGVDANFRNSIILLNDLLRNTEINDDLLKKIVNERKIMNKLAKTDVNFKSEILQSYALYGKKSEYLKQLSLKDIKKLKAEDLIAALNEIRKYQTTIHYVGNKKIQDVSTELKTYFYVPQTLIRSNSPVIIKPRKLKSNLVYFLNDKKAIQTQINYSIPTTPIRQSGRALIEPFNQYFGLGSNSILFKELREEKSLAYSVYGYQWSPYRHNDSSVFFGYLSTQANRTIDAIKEYNTVLNVLPLDHENTESVKNWIFKDLSVEPTDFRNYSKYVEYWHLQGYQHDPRKDYLTDYQNLNPEVFQSFHSLILKGKFRIIDVVGDSKKFDYKNLSQFGSFEKIKLKDIYKF